MQLDHKYIIKLDKHARNDYWKPSNYYEQLQNKVSIETFIPLPNAEKYINTRKVRIYPSTEQKTVFNQFLGANRYFYNKTNDYIKNNPDDKKRFNHYYMRQKIFEHVEPWHADIPYDTRSLSVKQCITSYKSALTNLKNGNIENFDISFLSKRLTNQVFYVDTRAYDFEKSYIFSRRLKKNKNLRINQFLEKTTCSNLIILKTKPGIWYLCVPYHQEAQEYTTSIYKNVFIDPGSRTFLTCYNPQENTYMKFGDNFVDELMPLGKKIDKLASLRSDSKKRTKYNLSKRMAKLRYHIKNKVNELHYQTCNTLTKHYQNIFLPHLDTIKLSDHITRNINSKAVRKMMTLSHGMFRSRLEHVVKTKQRSLFYVPEAYTTKTCPACGHKNDIGASKVHKCQCGYEKDRDETGALNICISTLLRTNC